VTGPHGECQTWLQIENPAEARPRVSVNP
jgi:hypothetical protein